MNNSPIQASQCPTIPAEELEEAKNEQTIIFEKGIVRWEANFGVVKRVCPHLAIRKLEENTITYPLEFDVDIVAMFSFMEFFTVGKVMVTEENAIALHKIAAHLGMSPNLIDCMFNVMSSLSLPSIEFDFIEKYIQNSEAKSKSSFPFSIDNFAILTGVEFSVLGTQLNKYSISVYKLVDSKRKLVYKGTVEHPGEDKVIAAFNFEQKTIVIEAKTVYEIVLSAADGQTCNDFAKDKVYLLANTWMENKRSYSIECTTGECYSKFAKITFYPVD